MKTSRSTFKRTLTGHPTRLLTGATLLPVATAIGFSLATHACGSAGGIAPDDVGTVQSRLWSNGSTGTDANKTWTGWAYAGGGTSAQTAASADAPAVVSTSSATMLLERVSDQSGAYRYWLWQNATGVWDQATTFTPGAWQTSPAAVNRGGDVIDVVGRASDQYWHIYWANNTWSNPEPIGGWGGAPAVSAPKAGTSGIDVWVTGTDGNIWHRGWRGSWASWENIGAPPNVHLITAPAVVVRNNNTVDIVADASDNHIYHMYISPQGVRSEWEQIPTGQTQTKAALSSPSDDRLDVWEKGASDGRYYHFVWTQAAGWSGADLAVNTVPTGATEVAFQGGPSVDIASTGLTTIAGIDSSGQPRLRTWADYVTGTTPTPAVPAANKAGTSDIPTFGIDENIAAVVGGVAYLSLGAGRTYSQTTDCLLNGAGRCAATQVSLPALPGYPPTSQLGTCSFDHQIVPGYDGNPILLFQGVWDSTHPTSWDTGMYRGVEHIFHLTGGSWTYNTTVDPCNPNGPFSWLDCVQGTSPVCTGSSGNPKDCNCGPSGLPPSGMDRPEALGSAYDNSVYIAVGDQGANTTEDLFLLRSNTASLQSWTAMNTNLSSEGAAALVENSSMLYFARCDHGNVSAYAMDKAHYPNVNYLVGLGNIDVGCAPASGQARADVVTTLLQYNGAPVFRWAYPNGSGVKFGFSRLTPGGMVTVQQSTVAGYLALPSMVGPQFQQTSGSALVYWYEWAGGTWFVRYMVSNGVGAWSTISTLTSWPGSYAAISDYMKGGYFTDGSGKPAYLLQWRQSDDVLHEAVVRTN